MKYPAMNPNAEKPTLKYSFIKAPTKIPEVIAIMKISIVNQTLPPYTVGSMYLRRPKAEKRSITKRNIIPPVITETTYGRNFLP